MTWYMRTTVMKITAMTMANTKLMETTKGMTSMTTATVAIRAIRAITIAKG